MDVRFRFLSLSGCLGPFPNMPKKAFLMSLVFTGLASRISLNSLRGIDILPWVRVESRGSESGLGYGNLHSTLHKLVKQLFLIGFLPQKARIRIGVQIWA